MTTIPTDVLGGVIGLLVVATVFGVVDLVRQPGWAWKAAGEPKIVCLLLVVLLPGVGLAIYFFGARPRVVAIAAQGRAAALPFERFLDRSDAVAVDDRTIGVLSRSTIGSFGQTVARPIRATSSLAQPVPDAAVPVAAPAAAPVAVPAAARAVRTPVPVPSLDGPVHGSGFFDDPDVLPAATGTTTIVEEAPVGTPAGADDATDLRLPAGIGHSYNPRQRTSLDEGRLGGSGPPAATATRAAGAPAGPTASAGAIAPTLAAPRVGTSTPEIFRPKPQAVTPISGTGVGTGPGRPMLAARWMSDPTGRHQYRYWDGTNWTENVYDAGVESRDAVAS